MLKRMAVKSRVMMIMTEPQNVASPFHQSPDDIEHSLYSSSSAIISRNDSSWLGQYILVQFCCSDLYKDCWNDLVALVLISKLSSLSCCQVVPAFLFVPLGRCVCRTSLHLVQIYKQVMSMLTRLHCFASWLQSLLIKQDYGTGRALKLKSHKCIQQQNPEKAIPTCDQETRRRWRERRKKTADARSVQFGS